jgi:hypothetical protein
LRISFSRTTASKCEGNSIAQWICHRPDLPRSHERNARAWTSPFSSTGNTRTRLPYRRNAAPYTALLSRLHEVPKGLSASIVVDLYPSTAVGLAGLFQG